MSGTALATKDKATTTALFELYGYLTREILRWQEGSMSQIREVQAHIADLERYRVALHDSMEQK